MKINNKGFIAISLIYSFFLIFIMTLLLILSDYAKNRVLLNDVKKSTMEYLDDLAGFNSIYVDNKTYSVNELVSFGNESWSVLKDNGTNVTLILNRELTTEEVSKALNETSLTGVSSGNKTLMCNNIPNSIVCSYKDYGTYTEYAYYTWNTSIAYKVVENWFSSRPNLNRAKALGGLVNMDFNDGIANYTSYIRIPTSSEYAIINNANIWYLTSYKQEDGISYNNIGGTSISTHDNYKSIKPIISVNKSNS